MGRLTLLLVLAAAIGGSVLTLGTRHTLLEATSRQSEVQADVLAREIAETGESIALSRIMGNDGFVDPTTGGLTGPIDYNNGEFEVTVDSYSPEQVTFTVTGVYGGAIHSIQSTYEFDPMDAPGPLWLDVPYATSSMGSGTRISGTADDHPVHFDRRRHDELKVESLVSLSGLSSALGSAVSAAGSALATPAAAAWTGDDGLLEDLNINDGEGMYQAAIGAMTGTDRTLSGPWTQAGVAAWGTSSTPDQITRVTGDLTVTGNVSGHGALVVEGALRVPASGSLTWTGLVIVRSQRNVLPIELDGTVSITGSMIVSQEAFPPGGHLDVSTYHNPTSSAPQGVTAGRPAPVDQPGTTWTSSHPWWQHSHAFDLTPTTAPRGDHVIYLRNGLAGPHESAIEFKRRLATIDADEMVYLEFANAANHGFSRYNIGLSGLSAPITGSIRSGFRAFASSDNDFRSKPFRAGDLQNLDVDVASLRALRQSFDPVGATSSWPSLIGWDWSRRDALAMRLVRASDDARLYESSLYWHMRQDEVASHEIEEAAWRARILAGEEFGTKLRFSDNVSLTFQIGPIAALSDKMGFDGNEVILVSTAAEHITPEERRANDTMEQPEAEPGRVTLCHMPGRHNERTLTLDVDAAGPHRAHGDTEGTCGSTTEEPPTEPGSCSAPSDPVEICNKPGRGSSVWRDRTVRCDQVEDHVAHGCRTGTCASNGLPTR